MTPEQITQSRIAHYTEVLHDYIPSAQQVEVTSAERVETEQGIRHTVAAIIDGWHYVNTTGNYVETLRTIAIMHKYNTPTTTN
jgi:hypothetical protein